jgi:hypothetical protein
MGMVTCRIAGTRDAFLVRTFLQESIRLTFMRKFAFVSTLFVWNKKVDALPLRTIVGLAAMRRLAPILVSQDVEGR